MNRTTEYTLSKIAAIFLIIEGVIGAIIAIILGFEPVTHKISQFFLFIFLHTHLFLYL
ncbi:hypothetical protein AAHB53_22735 [Niallia circulans]